MRDPRHRVLVGVVALALALVGGACGGSGGPPPATPALPAAVVPTRLTVDGGAVVQPNSAQSTIDAFASAGRRSLVVEAGMWELRKADRLAGALQVVTLDGRRIDTLRSEDRDAVRDQILAGAQEEIEVGGVPVWSAKDGDRVLAVWFGRQVLCVLQVRTDDLDPEEALDELVSAVVGHSDWPGLPPETFEDDEEEEDER